MSADPTTATAAGAIARLHEDWVAAVRRGDAEGLRDLVTADYEVWPNGAPPMHGPDTTVAGMAAALAKYVVEQAFESTELIVAGDWAFERGVESVRATPREGGPAVSRSQRAFLILRRDAAGRWRYARGMTGALPT